MNVKEDVSIKCNGIDELTACRKKLINFGFSDDNKWNDSQIRQSVYLDYPDMCFLLIRSECNNIQVHTHNCCDLNPIYLNYEELDSYLNKTYNMEKFEKLDNDQKELVKYWIDKYKKNVFELKHHDSFIEKHLTPEPVIEVGKVYEIGGSSMVYVIGFNNCSKTILCYGFDFSGNWNEGMKCKILSTDIYKEVSWQDWRQRLTKEANRLGFVKGAKFHPIFNAKEEPKKSTCICNGYFYSNYPSQLSANITGMFGQLIMSDGKWAEIIDEKAEIRESVARLEAELKELKSKL